MGLRQQEANPLAVYNMRRMDFCPPHFETVKFELRAPEKNIVDWLYENTEGRFYAGQNISDTEVFTMCFCIGFEAHSEATYLSMFLPEINVNPNFI